MLLAPSFLIQTDLYHPSSTALNWDWGRSLILSTSLLFQSSHRQRYTSPHLPFIAAASGFAHILTIVPTGCPTFSFLSPAMLTMRLPWCLIGEESACRCRRPGFHPGVGKIPWRRKWLPTPVFFPGKSHRSLVGCSPWGGKELDTAEQLNNNNNSHNKPLG